MSVQVESQEDLVREKEEQLVQVKSRLTFTDSTDSAISSLEESITEKDRQIERFIALFLEPFSVGRLLSFSVRVAFTFSEIETRAQP